MGNVEKNSWWNYEVKKAYTKIVHKNDCCKKRETEKENKIKILYEVIERMIWLQNKSKEWIRL